jgi:hypothetical protein
MHAFIFVPEKRKKDPDDDPDNGNQEKKVK